MLQHAEIKRIINSEVEHTISAHRNTMVDMNCNGSSFEGSDAVSRDALAGLQREIDCLSRQLLY
jgi:hypothetical protein